MLATGIPERSSNVSVRHLDSWWRLWAIVGVSLIDLSAGSFSQTACER
jgi:hypothetical protein